MLYIWHSVLSKFAKILSTYSNASSCFEYNVFWLWFRRSWLSRAECKISRNRFSITADKKIASLQCNAYSIDMVNGGTSQWINEGMNDAGMKLSHVCSDIWHKCYTFDTVFWVNLPKYCPHIQMQLLAFNTMCFDYDFVEVGCQGPNVK